MLALSPSTVSKHLSLLKSAGLVNDRKEKKWVHYSLDLESDDPYVAGILRELSAWLERDPVIASDRVRLAEATEGRGAGGRVRALRLRRGDAVKNAPLTVEVLSLPGCPSVGGDAADGRARSSSTVVPGPRCGMCV